MIDGLLKALRSQEAAPRIQDEGKIQSHYKYWQVRIMYSTVIGYATFYFVRKNFSIANNAMSKEFGFTNTDIGLILTVATIVYGISKFLSGVLADLANPRYFMPLGLILSAIVNIVFGFSAALPFFIVLWALNNFFQGMGMPPCAKLLNAWFSRGQGGRAWGIWNMSHQIGGGLIILLAGFLVQHLGWRSAFYIPGIFSILIALFLLNRLRDSPQSLGLPSVHEYANEPEIASSTEERPSTSHIFKHYILGNRALWIACIANVFVYVVRTGFFDWGPRFLINDRGFSTAQASISTFVFEITGIFGAFIAGWLSDAVFRGRRGATSAVFMILLGLGVLGMILIPSSNFVLLTVQLGLIGFLVYGPQVLVAVIAAENTDPRAVATAVGMTGLFGYIGATVCQFATGYLVDHQGWKGGLILWMSAAVIGTVLFTLIWKPLQRKA
ncbi:MAG: MFS transporter [Leptospirales bacterium]|nr:MFS transporter [Leptospirales bacterium]